MKVLSIMAVDKYLSLSLSYGRNRGLQQEFTNAVMNKRNLFSVIPETNLCSTEHPFFGSV